MSLTLDLHRAQNILACLALCACSKDTSSFRDVGDPGGEVEQCQLDERAVGLDEPTPIGASAAELFRWITGEHAEPLVWLQPNEQEREYVRLDGLGPEQGVSGIELGFEPLGAHFIARSPIDPTSGAICASSLTLDVNLHLSTASGALDEQLQTTLDATQPNFAQAVPTYLPLDTLHGSFLPQLSFDPGFDYAGPPRLSLSLILSEAGAIGSLALVTAVSNGRTSAGDLSTIARFPDDTSLCQGGRYLVATDRTVEGVSRDAVLQQLNGASPALLDGGPASIELEYTGVGERACVQPGTPTTGPTTLWFPATARLHSSDGRIDGSIDTTLAGEASTGSLRSLADSHILLRDRAAAAATLPSYAVQDPIDFSGYDGGSFAFSADVNAQHAGGSLIVSGVTEPQCPAERAPSVEFSNCTKEMTTELWGARWSEP